MSASMNDIAESSAEVMPRPLAVPIYQIVIQPKAEILATSPRATTEWCHHPTLVSLPGG